MSAESAALIFILLLIVFAAIGFTLFLNWYWDKYGGPRD
jgi:hypothetical protein